MKFNAYHKIPQFKDVIRNINFKATFVGLDEEGSPVCDNTLPKPILTFIGTVKIHGSNAGIVYTPEEGIRGLKRKSLLSKNQYDQHFEFNRFVQVTHKDYFTKLLSNLWDEHCVKGQQITIFGEFAGSNIQKGVGVSYLDKSFFIFGCKVRTIETDEDRWIDISHIDFTNIDNVYHIKEFPTFSMEIDFNNPKLIQNKLIELTEQVEKDCPVARQLLGKDFDKELVGEGLVWTCFWKNEKYIFKTKGQKHSVTKTKKLVSVDLEVLESINKFVDYACTSNRIKQGIQEVEAKEKKDMPNLLRWVANDIIAEENDTLITNNLEWKQVAKECNNRVRQYFFEYLDTLD